MKAAREKCPALPILLLLVLIGSVSAGCLPISGLEPRVLDAAAAGEFESSKDGLYLVFVTPGSGYALFGHMLLRLDGYCFAYSWSEGGFLPEFYTMEHAFDFYIEKANRTLVFSRLLISDSQRAELTDILVRTVKSRSEAGGTVPSAGYLNNCTSLLAGKLSEAGVCPPLPSPDSIFPRNYFLEIIELGIGSPDIFAIGPDSIASGAVFDAPASE